MSIKNTKNYCINSLSETETVWKGKNYYYGFLKGTNEIVA